MPLALPLETTIQACQATSVTFAGPNAPGLSQPSPGGEGFPRVKRIMCSLGEVYVDIFNDEDLQESPMSMQERLQMSAVLPCPRTHSGISQPAS